MLFNAPGTDAAYDRYLEPPTTHEIDECSTCHDGGEHDDQALRWMGRCEECRAEVAKKSSHVMIEFSFAPQDVEIAMRWAKSKGYYYDGEPVEALLHDAMLDNVIKTEKWDIL